MKDETQFIFLNLIADAIEKSGFNIKPVETKRDFSECFTFSESLQKFLLWYNTEDESTHVVVSKNYGSN